MEIQYTKDNVIQGITIHNTDQNFNQSIDDLMEVLNENQYYRCFQLGRRLVIAKKDFSDIVSFERCKINIIAITNNEIAIDTDSISLTISNNESKFSTYLY